MAGPDERRREIEAEAERVAPLMARAIEKGMEAAAGSFSASGKAELPPDFNREIEGALSGIVGAGARLGGRQVVGEFKDLFPALQTKQDEESLFDQLVREFLEAYGARKIWQIVETTREQIAQIVQAGQKEGLGLGEIAAAIRDAAPQISRTRAAIIARTETHSSSSYASHQVARRSRRPLMKVWRSVEDSRTRDFGEGDGEVDDYNHRKMDEVAVPIAEPYQVPTINGGTEPMMYPGDPAGSPGNVINCRCVEIYRRAE